MTQHIRPTLRTHRGCHTEPKRLHPEDLARILRPTPARVRPVREWTPSIYYERLAQDMHPDVRAAYIARCEEWFVAHPPRPPRESRPPENVDIEAVAALIAKYGAEVPLADFSRVGYSVEAVERVRAQRQWYRDHASELAAEIERRWPGSSKSKPKVVIKAVKKKMPI
jgi:hypothetical protein